MKITIHRGAAQIGGCITEICTGSARIIIDLGSNLPGSKTADFTSEQIEALTNGADAVFYTHYHGDHVGFIADVPKTIPQYIGKGAAEVMECKYQALSAHGDYSKELDAISRMKHYRAGEAVFIKDIKITPYYCSHSAFDSYMFKIEAEGKVILHTGDFRGHGYMGSSLIKMLKTYIHQVDVLITEGTMLSRTSEMTKTEEQRKEDGKDVLKHHKYAYALCSSTDIDRLASLHAACKETNRHFYVDMYQSSILNIFTNHTSAEIYDFTHTSYKDTTFELWQYDQYNKKSVVDEMKRRGFLMPVRCSMSSLLSKMNSVYTDEEPVLIYSMWNGYWKGTEEQQIPSVLEIRSMFKEKNIFNIHTSGHADADTLADVCMTVNPRVAIIPIHKDKQTDYCSLPLSNELKKKVVTKNTSLQNFEIIIK